MPARRDVPRGTRSIQPGVSWADALLLAARTAVARNCLECIVALLLETLITGNL
jgi:hypothetical protein